MEHTIKKLKIENNHFKLRQLKETKSMQELKVKVMFSYKIFSMFMQISELETNEQELYALCQKWTPKLYIGKFFIFDNSLVIILGQEYYMCKETNKKCEFDAIGGFRLLNYN